MNTFNFRIILVFLLTLQIHVYSQQSAEVENIVKQMFVDMNNKDYDAILAMTHPKVFDIVSKDQLKTVLKSTFEGNKEFSLEIQKDIPEYKMSSSYSHKKNNLNYVFVTYNLQMKMTFLHQSFNAEQKKMMTAMMKVKDSDVTFISDNTVDVLMKNRMTILLKDDTTDNKWVMINYDPDSPMFYQILPTNLLETAKDYKQDLLLESKKNSQK